MNAPEEPTPPYPWHVYRCLHSGWIDWLVACQEDVRDVVVRTFGGADLAHFVLGLMRYRLATVTTRLDPERGWLVGLVLHADTGDVRVLENVARHVGLTDEALLACNRIAMEHALEEVIADA